MDYLTDPFTPSYQIVQLRYGKFAIASTIPIWLICIMELDKKEVCMRVGTNVRELRLKKGLTIEKLASEADMEYTQLSRIELGQINTSLYQIYKIANALSVKMPDLVKSIT
jgi:DNA-binding XRE family transcriptional regulator